MTLLGDIIERIAASKESSVKADRLRELAEKPHPSDHRDTERRGAGMRYVGFCYDSGAWGGDLTGILLVQHGDGWAQAGSHISSGEGWSQRDIEGHYQRRSESHADDTYEWAGRLTVDEAMARFPAASDPEPSR